MTLLLHCGAEKVTREMIDAVPVPEHTRSWRPMPYGGMIDYVKYVADRTIGAKLESEEYALNKKGDQMFALLTYDVGDSDTGLSIGMRSSLNKTLAPAVCMGPQVFVCDNLCFRGDAFKIVRKNTKNVERDFRGLVSRHVTEALPIYEATKKDNDAMKGLPCNERRGYALLGVAMGEGVLTPTQASIAFGDWKEPRHEDFADRNLWSLYNCVTEGLKKGAPAQRLDRQAKAHDWFMGMRQLQPA